MRGWSQKMEPLVVLIWLRWLRSETLFKKKITIKCAHESGSETLLFIHSLLHARYGHNPRGDRGSSSASCSVFKMCPQGGTLIWFLKKYFLRSELEGFNSSWCYCNTQCTFCQRWESREPDSRPPCMIQCISSVPAILSFCEWLLLGDREFSNLSGTCDSYITLDGREEKDFSLPPVWNWKSSSGCDEESWSNFRAKMVTGRRGGSVLKSSPGRALYSNINCATVAQSADHDWKRSLNLLVYESVVLNTALREPDEAEVQCTLNAIARQNLRWSQVKSTSLL